MAPGAALLFAIAAGAAVGNLYWAQPLLATLADSFGVSTGTAGLVVTITQIGYAIGVFFLVPLGDIVNRKRMIPAFMLLSAVALAASGLAPSFPVLLATFALVGLSTVAGQLLVPLAGDLATDEQRGRVLGTVASGAVLGLLIARAATGLMLILAAVMARYLPSLTPRDAIPYRKLLLSVLRTAAQNARVRITAFLGAATMSVFTLFWTALTFLLAGAPYSYPTTQIGLISLVGIAGAVAVQRAGRLFDRGLALPAIGMGLLLALVSVTIAGVGASFLAAILVAIALFSVGIQSVQVLVQTRMLSLDPSARSRLNTVMVVGNFIGGAIGSALAGLLWSLGGWVAVMTAAAGIIGIALTIWFAQRKHGLAG
jgi:predicted MFS family arabinose efflux permease